ncbi:MAG: alpha-L-arabinofuranosidase C-terminal domain-containing protein [Eubacteriales bacterium]|nr:alpha-L-arabinofuranosidase C-terminal domain-containing protein [Eubacteriales bacterium]
MRVYAEHHDLIGRRDPMLYGQFLEHFHRQIYGGVYDPESRFSDGDGFRTDVLEALRAIHVPVIRWPGGCFVSSYHWKDGVGKERIPCFDKAWRVEEPNLFGTDEFILLCQKLNCAPYICTNAGTGTAEEMSDWVEYCNLEREGKFARLRIQNGHERPFDVRYWSIGNENYGAHEIGAKSETEWGRLVAESAKMMKHVDPRIELSAAALTDLDWNINLLRHSAQFLDWISIHQYWDRIHETNRPASYEGAVAFTAHTEDSIRKVRGLLTAMGLEHKIRIAFDEWNLKEWYHPRVHTVEQGVTKEEYLYPRDGNDDNSLYTMGDAVFTACFLNALHRNCDIVGMANFAPAINTRGCICTHEDGLVLRSTYFVFYLYTNYMGEVVRRTKCPDMRQLRVKNSDGAEELTDQVDLCVTELADGSGVAVAAVNKSAQESAELSLELEAEGSVTGYYICGRGTDSYNDVGRTEIGIEKEELGRYEPGMRIRLRPHSVEVIRICR